MRVLPAAAVNDQAACPVTRRTVPSGHLDGSDAPSVGRPLKAAARGTSGGAVTCVATSGPLVEGSIAVYGIVRMPSAAPIAAQRRRCTTTPGGSGGGEITQPHCPLRLACAPALLTHRPSCLALLRVWLSWVVKPCHITASSRSLISNSLSVWQQLEFTCPCSCAVSAPMRRRQRYPKRGLRPPIAAHTKRPPTPLAAS